MHRTAYARIFDVQNRNNASQIFRSPTHILKSAMTLCFQVLFAHSQAEHNGPLGTPGIYFSVSWYPGLAAAAAALDFHICSGLLGPLKPLNLTALLKNNVTAPVEQQILRYRTEPQGLCEHTNSKTSTDTYTHTSNTYCGRYDEKFGESCNENHKYKYFKLTPWVCASDLHSWTA